MGEMREQSRKIATCGVSAALGVVIMILGAVTGLGLYVCPMVTGVFLQPIGKRWGIRMQITVWAAISLLSLVLVSDLEETLLFIGLFGWYPALRPWLQRKPKGLRIFLKLLIFNVVFILLEFVIAQILFPEVLNAVLVISLLVLGNLVFLLYDFTLPRMEWIVERLQKRFFPRS